MKMWSVVNIAPVLHLGEVANGGEVGAVHFKIFKHEFSTEETFGGQNWVRVKQRIHFP
jgi:hypothetical protein